MLGWNLEAAEWELLKTFQEFWVGVDLVEQKVGFGDCYLMEQKVTVAEQAEFPECCWAGQKAEQKVGFAECYLLEQKVEFSEGCWAEQKVEFAEDHLFLGFWVLACYQIRSTLDGV